MGREEHFYTREFYESAGLEPFLEHVKEYLSDQRTNQKTVPVSKTSAWPNGSGDVLFTFTDILMRALLDADASAQKAYEVALKYGFRGYSRGGKNGIFYLRKNDIGLLSAVHTLVRTHADFIKADLDIPRNGLDELRKVKIVHHDPSGKRVVGVYNTKNSRMLFLDFACY